MIFIYVWAAGFVISWFITAWAMSPNSEEEASTSVSISLIWPFALLLLFFFGLMQLHQRTARLFRK